MSAAHQSLHHLVAKAAWSDEALLAAVREQVLPALGPITAWIVDDTGFPKKGKHSVGVARQYCGALGKTDNCQVAVSLSLANERASLPIAYRLYLPEIWAGDPERRVKAGVPDEITFQTKPQIALEQIRAALVQGVTPGVVLADAGYGADMDFQEGLLALELAYVVGILPNTSVWPPGTAPVAGQALVGPRPAADAAAACARPRAGRGRSLGAVLAGRGLAHGDLARGQPRRAGVALRRAAGPSRASRLPAPGALARAVAPGRVARR